MKKAMNIYWTNGDTKEKFDNIKKAGYDAVLLGYYDKNDSLTIKEQFSYCKKIGLEISMVHCSYREPMLNDFWTNSEIGDKVEQDLINQIIDIKDYNISDFVIHTNGSKEVKNTQIGLNRIKNILKECEKYNINLCIENLYVAEQVEYIFDNISHKNLKICFDCGHKNFLTSNSDFDKKYSQYITTLHIHDNHGETDEHKMLGEGTIDLNSLADTIANSPCKYITTEIKYNNIENQLDILTENLKRLNILDKKINSIIENQNMIK